MMIGSLCSRLYVSRPGPGLRRVSDGGASQICFHLAPTLGGKWWIWPPTMSEGLSRRYYSMASYVRVSRGAWR